MAVIPTKHELSRDKLCFTYLPTLESQSPSMPVDWKVSAAPGPCAFHTCLCGLCSNWLIVFAAEFIGEGHAYATFNTHFVLDKGIQMHDANKVQNDTEMRNHWKTFYLSKNLFSFWPLHSGCAKDIIGIFFLHSLNPESIKYHILCLFVYYVIFSQLLPNQTFCSILNLFI